MKKSLLLIVVGLMSLIGYAQINSSSPSSPFGSRTIYSYGIMPTNLPTTGTYGKSSDAATVYNAWKSSFVVACTTGSRVMFNPTAQTVSEGIGYGMLLSAYAGDKPTFDALWQYYKANENTKGLMNWHINGCSGLFDANSANGATDADEDAAMALIIAAEQWASATSPYTYKNEALTLISAIRLYEFYNYQTLNGDGWGTGSTCRNPSYFAPAYYREFAKVETSQATFWNTAASTANSFLLTNRNITTGLVSNWADNNAIPNTCNGNLEFGFDAIRNPWRMATDVLWNGTSTASTGSDICTKMSSWANNSAGNLRGPCTLAGALQTTTYKNGTFAMIGLAFMGTTVTTYQTALNTAYTNIVGIGNYESYFERTLRCLTLFQMTGNFWKPGSGTAIAPTVTNATTDVTGTTITVNFSIPITFAAADYSQFTLKIGGTAVAGAITAITANGTSAAILSIALGKIAAGNSITIDYTPGTIKSTASTPIALPAFTAQSVTNVMSAGNTLIADCEDGNLTKLLTPWYSYADKTTTISPVSSTTTPFIMTLGGANGTDSAAIATGYLAKPASPDYESAGIGFTFKDPEAVYDLTGATGFSFWHKGEAVNFSVMLSTVTANKGYDYSYAVPQHTNWTLVEVKFSDVNFGQPSWMASSAPTEIKTWDPSKITKIQWQVKDGSARNYSFGIDEVSVMGKIVTLPTITTVDKTALLSKIAASNTAYSGSTEGTITGQYPTGSKAILLTAITAATAVNTSTTATQAQVDAAIITLNTALTTFQNSVIGVSKTALVTALSNAVTIYNTAVEGSATGQYPAPAKSDFNQAILAATLVNTTSTVTQAQVDAAVSTLNAAVTAFQAKAVSVDKSTLVTTISTAQLLYATSTEGASDGQYPVGSKATLYSAITAASAVNSNTSATQAQVNTALTTLATAIAVFQNAKIGVNKTALIVEITLAQTQLSSATEGAADGQYPVGSKATLQTAINAASVINSNTSATQAQVNIALSDLSNALVSFQNSVIGVNKTVLSTAITTTQYYYNLAVEGTATGQYPSPAKVTLQTAIDAASTVKNNTLATQAQVDVAVTSLSTALVTFQNSVVGVNTATLQTKVTEVSATLLLQSGNIGSANGDYPQSAWNDLAYANQIAQYVIDSPSSTQAEVDAQLTFLIAAITTFENAKITTAVAEVSNKVLNVYPIPCSDILHVESSKTMVTVTIINILGVMQQRIDVNESSLQLSVSALSKAFYFVEITNYDGTHQTVRITKE